MKNDHGYELFDRSSNIYKREKMELNNALKRYFHQSNSTLFRSFSHIENIFFSVDNAYFDIIFKKEKIWDNIQSINDVIKDYKINLKLNPQFSKLNLLIINYNYKPLNNSEKTTNLPSTSTMNPQTSTIDFNLFKSTSNDNLLDITSNFN